MSVSQQLYPPPSVSGRPTLVCGDCLDSCGLAPTGASCDGRECVEAGASDEAAAGSSAASSTACRAFARSCRHMGHKEETFRSHGTTHCTATELAFTVSTVEASRLQHHGSDVWHRTARPAHHPRPRIRVGRSDKLYRHRYRARYLAPVCIAVA